MFIRAIDHVNIRAPADDIVRLRRFYCDVVGLTEGWRPPFESRGHWLYAGETPLVHLVESGDGRNTGARSAVDHVSFRCSDLDAFGEGLRARGIEFRSSIVPGLGERRLLLRDPLGIGVEITAVPPE